MTDAGRWVTIEFEGQEYEINTLDFEDPDENMVRTLQAMEDGYQPAVYDAVRLLGVDTTGWRLSKLTRFMEAVKAETELSAGESSGSGKSSEPTAKRSSSRSSSRA